MFSLETLLMLGTLLFCLGGLLGTVFGRRFLPPVEQKHVEEQLQQTREELADYQREVGHHFSETSRLVNKLTQSYKEVHEHLASSAMQLTSPEVSRRMIEAGQGKLNAQETAAIEEVEFEAPRDWAPRKPGEKGVLSEDFGLQEQEQPTPIEAASATQPRENT